MIKINSICCLIVAATTLFPAQLVFAEKFEAWDEATKPPSQHHLEFRSIDGRGNNIVNPEFDAAAGVQLKRRMTAKYIDQFSQMPDHGNPRVESELEKLNGSGASPLRRRISQPDL